MKKDCWWNESARSGKDTASPDNPITPVVNTTTEPPTTGMLLQSDDGEAVIADSAQWLYSVTKREPSREDFLIDSGVCANRVWRTAREANPGDLEWSSGQPLDISSPRRATRRFACAHETVSMWRETFRLRPRILYSGDVSCQLDKCATNIITFRSTGGTIFNESIGNRIEVERAGSVYRLRTDTSAKTKPGTRGVSVAGFRARHCGCR